MKWNHVLPRRMFALTFAVLFTSTAAGCSMESLTQAASNMIQTKTGGVVPGKRLNNSAWINSDLEGALDAATEVNAKDDFHSTINKDWILDTDISETGQFTALSHIQTTLDDQVLHLFDSGDIPCDTEIIPQESADHLQDLLVNLSDLAGNWEQRNSLGVEPLRPYLESIEDITDLDSLTDYLCGENGPNLLQETLLNTSIDLPISSRDSYTVHLTGPNHLLLDDPEKYHSLSNYSYLVLAERQNAVSAVLQRIGYTEQQAKKLLEDCLWFEEDLCRELPFNSEKTAENYTTRIDNIYTLKMLKERQGNFPLTTLLERTGLSDSKTFLLYQPLYLSSLGKLYTTSNLEDIKAYLTVHTVLDALPLLDEECDTLQKRITAQENLVSPPQDEEEEAPVPTDPTAKEEETKNDGTLSETINTYVQPLLKEAMQELYVARYCTAQAKQEITSLVDDSIAYYKTMLENEDWLGEKTRQKAVEKLESIHTWVLYPDTMTDFSSLSFSSYAENGNFLDATAAITTFKTAQSKQKINEPINWDEWNMEYYPTAIVNAFYLPSNNSIVIPAGFLADGFTYSPDAPLESNLARLGTVVSHEISHAFDTTGYLYDKDGLKNSWWTEEDEVAFQLRATQLANHYSALSVLPGLEGGYNGNTIKSEAIADMGGMKCMLGLAAQNPNFDYELFFTSYAQLWAAKMNYNYEINTYTYDEHPLAFLRTNVTVQQFDEFYTTFDIEPGDGMYLAPEKRILVW